MGFFITGFTDAEGSFMITIDKSNSVKLGYQVRARFSICLHEKDSQLLYQIKDYFSVGSIVKSTKAVHYVVTNLNELVNVLIPHFENYPLITQKRCDYELFKLAVSAIKNKEHLTDSGFRKILNIKASINKGIPESLKAVFPDLTPLPRPLSVNGQEIKDPRWVVGFVEGDGCFSVYLIKSPNSKFGYRVTLRFSISQHSRDSALMQGLVQFFGCGQYRIIPNKSIGEFIIENVNDINDKIIPFFDNYPLQGVKAKDYAAFREVVEIVKSKSHLTELGLEKIRDIKLKMDSNRKG